MKHDRTFKLADIKMTVAALDTLSRYVSPINPAVFPHLTLVLLGIGLFFTAWFFVYEVSPNSLTQRRIITVFCLGHIQQVHPRALQRAAHRCCCLSFHGIRNAVPSAVGGNLCVSFILITKCDCEMFSVHHQHMHFYCLSM